jgi:hypothetical protein
MERSSAVLCENFPRDLPFHIGETHFASGVAEGEALVVEAEEVQDGGVPVLDVHLAGDGFVAGKGSGSGRVLGIEYSFISHLGQSSDGSGWLTKTCCHWLADVKLSLLDARYYRARN